MNNDNDDGGSDGYDDDGSCNDDNGDSDDDSDYDDDDDIGVCRTEPTYLCIVFYFVQLPELGLFIEVVGC